MYSFEGKELFYISLTLKRMCQQWLIYKDRIPYYEWKNIELYQEYFQSQYKTVADVPFLDFLWPKTRQGMTENTCKKKIWIEKHWNSLQC